VQRFLLVLQPRVKGLVESVRRLGRIAAAGHVRRAPADHADQEFELGLVGGVPAQIIEDRVGVRVVQFLPPDIQAQRHAQKSRREPRILQRVPDVKVDALLRRDRGRGGRLADFGHARGADRFQAEQSGWIGRMGHGLALA